MSAKPSPYEAFERNFSDAISLIRYARAFENRRNNRRMRKELRSRVGQALKVPMNRQDELDCIENADLFVVFKPEGRFHRDQFSDLQPLLRQSLVAACAALETYVADKAMEFVGSVVTSREIPSRMKDISLTVGDWGEIEKYQRRGWGIRSIIERHIRETSSVAPNKIGIVLATIGITNWAAKIDKIRGVEKDTTVKELEKITKRRNLIAHAADRKGRSRESAKLQEVGQQLQTIKSVVNALEEMLGNRNV